MRNIQAHTPSCASTQLPHKVQQPCLTQQHPNSSEVTQLRAHTQLCKGKGGCGGSGFGVVWCRRGGREAEGCGAELSHGGCSRVISQHWPLSLVPSTFYSQFPTRFITNSQLVLQSIPSQFPRNGLDGNCPRLA